MLQDLQDLNVDRRKTTFHLFLNNKQLQVNAVWPCFCKQPNRLSARVSFFLLNKKRVGKGHYYANREENSI